MNLQIRERTKKFINIYIIRRVRQMIVSRTVELVKGPEEFELERDQLAVLCLAKDSQLYVRPFIEHYFSLGAKHIVIMDNGSTDDTVDIASQYDRVTILRSLLPFREYKMAMRHHLIERFGIKDRWLLYADIDEHFDYPYSNLVTLDALLTYLDERGYTAVVAHMLDMFPALSLRDLSTQPLTGLAERHCYYDLSDIVMVKYYYPRNELPNGQIQIYFDGIRKALFSPGAGPPFILTKHPLFRLDGRLQPLFFDEHDVRLAKIADLTGVLFHYKFHADFEQRVQRAVQDKNYVRDSEEYVNYLATLEKNPDSVLKRPTSKSLQRTNDLLHNGFIYASDDYVKWARSR